MSNENPKTDSWERRTLLTWLDKRHEKLCELVAFMKLLKTLFPYPESKRNIELIDKIDNCLEQGSSILLKLKSEKKNSSKEEVSTEKVEVLLNLVIHYMGQLGFSCEEATPLRPKR